MPDPRPATDPTALMDWRDGVYAADLFTAAIAELDLFTWLSRHPATAGEICRELGLAARPTDVMLTLFVAKGLLTRDEGVYRLTPPAAEQLTADSPWSLAPYCGSLRKRPGCQELIGVLRTGKPANWGSGKDSSAWETAMADESFARSFTRAMDCRGAWLGPALAEALPCSRHKSLLDIAGGSGVYSSSVAERYPHLTAAVLEKPPVNQIAREAIAKRGLQPRVSVIEADMFRDPLPGGFDIHLYSHVLHDWAEPEIEALLAKSFDALAPGGIVAIHDAHLNAAKTGPLAVAEYSVLLMHSTQGRCYSITEMKMMLKAAGFTDVASHPTVAHRSVIVARGKPQVGPTLS